MCILNFDLTLNIINAAAEKQERYFRLDLEYPNFENQKIFRHIKL